MNPVLDPAFWKMRIGAAPRSEFHRSIYDCSPGLWNEIAERHKAVLAEVIGNDDSVLDAGCGYGRLLTLLPPTWRGSYMGVDLSPDMMAVAKATYPNRVFIEADLRWFALPAVRKYDWLVGISLKQMILGNYGEETWRWMLHNMRFLAKRCLFLEYEVVYPPEILE